jgi:ribose transport system substrate-binding protein
VRRSRIALPLVLATLVFSACGGSDQPRGATGDGLTIAVVPKGTTHDFWRSIHAGAVQAAQELSAEGTPVQVIWKGPLREDDREQQVQVVEGFISQRIDGIVLAPLDDRALVRPVEESQRAGIPVVVIDSGLQSDAIVSFVATDNRLGGRMAADRMAELVGGSGRVLLLRYQEGSASTRDREEGFVEQIRSAHPGIQLVTSDQYAGPTRDTAKRASENLLNRFGTQLDGIFTVNESSTVGMLLALQDIGRAGNVAFVGFDASETLVDALRSRQLNGIIVQNPMRMGYLGVRTMVSHLRGEPVQERIDTGVTLVTPDNMDTAELQELLNPPIQRYLARQ